MNREYKEGVPTPAEALPGRDAPMVLEDRHFVTGRALLPPFPPGLRRVLFGMGCFWGPERAFWGVDGVHVTAAGYAGGHTPNPTYGEVCSGRTAHAEVVLVVYDPDRVDFQTLLRLFWEGHDPTQGMRQGNDVGTQYRSALYVDGPDALEAALRSRDAYQRALKGAGHGEITTEIRSGVDFYYAEEGHQQYLARVPGGYCGHGGTGVACPVGVDVPAGA